MASEPDKIGPQVVGPMKQDELAHLMAWDTTRLWGTAIQVFLNKDHALFVLREMVGVTTDSPDGERQVAQHNVGSFVVPLKVAEELRDMLQQLDFEAVKNAPE